MIKSYWETHIPNPSNPKIRRKYGNFSAFLGLGSNAILSFSKIAIGTLTGSISIRADGFNNLTDMLSSLVSILGFALASKPADREHPFGHARIEYIASSIVGLIILWAGGSLLWESVQTLLNPTKIQVDFLTFGVLVFSILVKIFLYRFNFTLGKRIHSDLVVATGLDARNDVLATGGVLVSMLILQLSHINIDPFMGIFVSLIILKSGIDTLKTTIDSILGEGPSFEKVQELTDFIRSYEGVLGIHDLMVHDYGPGRKFLTVHVEVDGHGDIIQLHELIDQIERDLEEEYNLNATIHMDPLLINDPKTSQIRQYIAFEIGDIDPNLGFHDFRIVDTYQGTNIIFDLLMPVDYKWSSHKLLEEIEDRVYRKHPEYKLIITFDLDYHNELGLEEN